MPNELETELRALPGATQSGQQPNGRAPSPLSGSGLKLISIPILIIAIVGVIAMMLLITSAWRSVNPGYVGVVFDKVNHRVTAGILEPGWAFINPFTQSIQEYPVTIQTYSMVQKGSEGQVEGDDSVKIQSSEGQQLNLDVVIQYQVKKDEAGALYQDWGGASIETVEDRVVRQYALAGAGDRCPIWLGTDRGFQARRDCQRSCRWTHR
ncbi:MAG: hypothetical protein IPK16_10405 [Anaerolineales bacterium]|nr:hypothetical protein [Anaerolineales bacterium]